MINLSSFLLMAPPPAGGEAGGVGSMMPSILMFAAIILIFYFLMIRPQQKRQKELQNMLQSLKVGDAVITTSGIHGVIEQVNETTIVLKVDNTKITFEKSAIIAKQT
jgi:preprotein translocase subunit YajC